MQLHGSVLEVDRSQSGAGCKGLNVLTNRVTVFFRSIRYQEDTAPCLTPLGLPVSIYRRLKEPWHAIQSHEYSTYGMYNGLAKSTKYGCLELRWWFCTESHLRSRHGVFPASLYHLIGIIMQRTSETESRTLFLEDSRKNSCFHTPSTQSGSMA